MTVNQFIKQIWVGCAIRSTLRLTPVFFAMFFDPILGIVTLPLGVLMHSDISPYMGWRWLRFKPITSKRHFVPFKKNMVPMADDEITLGFYDHMTKLTEPTQQYLKSIHLKKKKLTYYDFANALLLDEQLHERMTYQKELEKAKAQFLGRNG